jgi:hypothetical protein
MSGLNVKADVNGYTPSTRRAVATVHAEALTENMRGAEGVVAWGNQIVRSIVS